MHKINRFSPDTNEFTQIVTYIAGAPDVLYYIGELPKARTPAVAIVGSRRPTKYGEEITYKFAFELAKKGVVIISGLALGTDGIAHKAAVDAGGKMIAILPTPLDNIAPRTNRMLAEAILDNGGALISEYEPGKDIYRSNFVERNRIVSGLSDAVLIPECTTRSGTLTTARFAGEQGKTVLAVPGPVTSPLSDGPNRLIKTGAALVTSVNDILVELGLDEAPKQSKLLLAGTPEEQTIINLIKQGLRDGDDILKNSGLTAQTYNQALTMLEINGTVRALGANTWTLN